MPRTVLRTTDGSPQEEGHAVLRSVDISQSLHKPGSEHKVQDRESQPTPTSGFEQLTDERSENRSADDAHVVFLNVWNELICKRKRKTVW